MTLEDRIKRLEDIEEIRRLRNMYHYFVNENLPDRFREIYTDDGVMQLDDAMKFEGINAIVEGFRKIPNPGPHAPGETVRSQSPGRCGRR
jgi:hypothetical protein